MTSYICLIIAILFLLGAIGAVLKLGPTIPLDEEESFRIERERGEAKRRKAVQNWNKPETDPVINQMFQECIVLMDELGVPISKNIAPEVTLTKAFSYFGRCCSKGSLKKYTEYDFYIEVSGHILGTTEKSIRNILIHELLHTIPGNTGHRGVWKKWANYVNSKTDYHIQRFDGDITEQDKEQLREKGFAV